MKKPRVLVIDDDALLCETVKIAVSQAGFEGLSLEDLSDAHASIRESQPDLILMDIYMPDLDGLDLIRRIKADPGTARIPVVILSGSKETIDVMSGIQAGAFEYITKPVDGELLIEKIRSILKLRAARDDAG